MERSGSKNLSSIIGVQQSDGKLFDASQYAFFGQDILGKADFGCLEVEEDNPINGFGDDEYRLFDREEESGVGSLSDLDDLSTIFSKLNRSVSGPRHPGVIGDRGSGSGSISRESSSASEWLQDRELTDYLDRHISDTDIYQQNKRWSSQPHLYSDPISLNRASSCPQEQHPFLKEPVSIPDPLFHSNLSLPRQHSHLPNLSPTISNLQLSKALHGSLGYKPSRSHLSPLGLSGYSQQSQPHNNLTNHMLYVDYVDHAGLLTNTVHNGSLPAHFLPPHHHSIGPFTPLQLCPLSSLPLHLSNLKTKPTKKSGRQNGRLSRQGSDGNKKSEKFRVQFSSKYMNSEEIESVLKVQHAATHTNDPYIDDYYHQARVAKRSTDSKSNTRFCPAQYKDSCSKSSRNGTETKSYIIRTSQPLLEAYPPAGTEEKAYEKRLEQEPMVAARIAVEDGLCLLLEVDDIDRLIQLTQPQDNIIQMKQRRQILLEVLATSLHLIDPLEKKSNSVGLTTEDDIVFLRLTSLPKGRKLVSKFLERLSPNSELARVVCMTIFRHLRFLFGGQPCLTVTGLVKTVSTCIASMDLYSLSACLAAVVCSSEQPPLRPIGNPSGDGASVILKAVLDRATYLLTNPRVSTGLQNPNLWQASFDAFFGLLTKYCLSKYEAMCPLSPEVDVLEAGRAFNGEMPVELLRASLPHTNNNQRKMLIDFSQRSIGVSGLTVDGPVVESMSSMSKEVIESIVR